MSDSIYIPNPTRLDGALSTANIVSALVGHADMKTTSRYDQSGFDEMESFVK